MQNLNQKVSAYEDSLYHLKKEIDSLDTAIRGQTANQVRENMIDVLTKIEKKVNQKIEDNREQIKKEYLNKEKENE